MLRPAGPLILLALVFAATSCTRGSSDAAPWVASYTDAMVIDIRPDVLVDAGTAANQPPDASQLADASRPRDASQLADASQLDAGADAGSRAPDAMVGDAATDASGPEMTIAVPPDPEPVPDCPISPIEFDTPAPAAPTGLLSIALSSWLQPVGVRERALIRVLDNQARVDTSYTGALSWTLPEGVEIVAATALTAGQAEVTFRFTRAGSFQLVATLSDDPRSGRAELIAYNPRLPVWELSVDPAALAALLDDPGRDDSIAGVLTIETARHDTLLRLHGGSSRYFDKKSFRFELLQGASAAPSYGMKLVLRAEYNDKTQLRNWLAFRMLRASTTLPTPRSKLVHFRINDRYYGVMHNVERVASRFLGLWGLSENGSLYEADPPLELASPGGNLTPLSPELYPLVYQHQAGVIDYTDLRKLIEETLTLPDRELTETIESEVMIDEYLQYIAALAAIQDHDQVRKNYYLYRDPAGDARWRVLPWDLDLTFGHLWSEENDVLEEKIVTDADIFVGAYDPDRGGFYNQLTDRVLGIPSYRARFRARVEQMLDTTMTRSEANMLLQAAVRCATPDLVADSLKRADNAEYRARVTEILDFLDARRAFVRGLPQ